MNDRRRSRQLAKEFGERGDTLGWFEVLYREAATDWSLVPWADLAPNPHLLSWRSQNAVDGRGRRALQIGCGLGDDAEALAEWGFQVTAFDIAPTAISICHERFPASSVEYCAVDLLNPPVSWTDAFDFVVEAYTLQVLPPAPRATAIEQVVSFVAPHGYLLVIARGREETDAPGEMPWPLTQAEFDAFRAHGLKRTSWEDFLDAEEPPVRRFRACYHRD